jgi:hypothetical protein
MESQDQDQLWACLACETARAWGTGAPFDAAFVPLLQCVPCGKPQRFTYVAVAEEVSAARKAVLHGVG